MTFSNRDQSDADVREGEILGALRADLGAPMTLTLYVLWIVDNKMAVPYHRQIDGQVADIVPLVVVLQGKSKMKK